MPGLMTGAELEARLGDRDLVVLEVSSQRPGAAGWHGSHIRGSHYLFWMDFCWTDDARELPPPDVMADRLGALGVSESSIVVLVGDPIQFAAYAYWVLAIAGFERQVYLLDGGRTAWAAQQRALTSEPTPAPERGHPVPASPVTGARVGREDVLARLEDPDRVLVDMRSPEEHSGERVAPPSAPFDHGATRGGRIPGAQPLYYERLLSSDDTFLDAVEIGRLFDAIGANEDRNVVTYCRMSHRASLGWFALTRVAGRDGVAVYDGSWTEWGSMVGMPIER